MAIGDSKRNKREIASSRAREFVSRGNGVKEWLWMTRNEKR